MKIYGDYYSGNCYKLALLASHLQLPHEWVHVDILAGETHSESFEAKNPNGKIPALELDDGRVLWESNAMLNFLAEGSALLPSESFARAQVLQWQFFEQYSHEPYLAVARYINRYLGLPPERKAEFEAKQAGGHKALTVMEKRLSEASWLVADAFSIADISLYAYTHVADEGGFDLSHYPAVSNWLKRVAELPAHVSIDSLAEAPS